MEITMTFTLANTAVNQLYSKQDDEVVKSVMDDPTLLQGAECKIVRKGEWTVPRPAIKTEALPLTDER